ncbi:MAG: TetR/AcrR family transcriptional regulator [Bacteroidales bacterium]|nr:TetR/AcrR family transcriptional regulator [Bacteroidales bacterium]
MRNTRYPGHKRQLRSEIVRVASEVFARFGYRKTTVEDIANQLHMVKSSLYYYFKGKDDIFNAVVDCEAKKIRRKLTDIIEQNDDPRTRLRKYIIARMQAMYDISLNYSSIFDPALIHYDFIENVRKKYDRLEHYTIRRILEEGIGRGVFTDQDPSLASTVICKAMKGLEIPLFWREKEGQDFHHVENLVHLLFYGVVKRQALH